MTDKNKIIAVVGAGIVGCSCALWLQKKGFPVVLIDPEIPGSGTSSGNAGSIANYACIPVNSPDIFKNLPSLMFAADSPLSVDIGYAITHLPWMLKFLSNCRPSRVAHISRILGKILLRTYEGFDPLIEYCDAEDLLSRKGFMQVHRNQAEFDSAWAANRVRKEQGVNFTELNAGEIQELEPGLKKIFNKGLLFEEATQVVNPLSLTQRFFDTFIQNCGVYKAVKVSAVSHTENRRSLHLDDGESLDADRVVIAAGAFSSQIKGIGTSQLPLDTERGYHLRYIGMQSLLSRPVGWHAAGFYATPMNDGLRLAGTVEIAGLSESKNPRHLNYLKKYAQQMLELPDQADQSWLGFRPTFPDSLPVIGYSTNSEHILYAFGHQHIGLTLSGITGKLISELINGETLSHDIRAFSPGRFL
ncbi:MAG: FAD-binding oxidoreductase [Gammaproteobacteria bacterium]|nr:FAD-binding oxidoreductase [Gammaproteobacteria bacterium]